MKRTWARRAFWVALVVVAASCGGGDDGDATAAETAAPPIADETAGDDTAEAPEPETAEPPAPEAPEDAPDEGGAALTVSGDVFTVDWAELPSTPAFIQPLAGADPFFHIHTDGNADGFFLAFEMYTVYGQEWTGQLGTFEISCDVPDASTGICPKFDPDGPGPAPVLGDDFDVSGTITINQLDADGYDIDVTGLTFSDGTSFAPFTMTG